MDRQYEHVINLQQFQSQLGLYQRMLQSSLIDPAYGTASELIAVHKTLLKIKDAIATHISTLESQLPGATQHAWDNNARVENLSCREMDVLSMFAKGYSYNETADALNCQLTTIQTHSKRIYKKLNVHSRSEAVFEASQLGLLQI